MKSAGAFLTAALVLSSHAMAGTLLDRAPAKDRQRVSPIADEANVEAGTKLYARECASCHGASREGLGKAPPLATLAVQNASAGALVWVLRNGSLRRGMPSFAHLPEAQRWQIVAFLRSR